MTFSISKNQLLFRYSKDHARLRVLFITPSRLRVTPENEENDAVVITPPESSSPQGISELLQGKHQNGMTVLDQLRGWTYVQGTQCAR